MEMRWTRAHRRPTGPWRARACVKLGVLVLSCPSVVCILCAGQLVAVARVRVAALAWLGALLLTSLTRNIYGP